MTASATNTPLTLLNDFAGLSTMHRQTVGNLTNTMDMVATAQRNTMEVSSKCRQLADSVVRHGRHSCEVLRDFDMITYEGEQVRMRDITSQAEALVGDMADEIIVVARDMMQMVFKVHDVNKMLETAQQAVQQLQAIHWQTRMLTLSAKAASATLLELEPDNRLSSQIDEVASEMGATISTLEASLTGMNTYLGEHAEKLASMAAIDIDEYIRARAQIAQLNGRLQSHAGQSRSMLDMLQQTITHQQSAIERLSMPDATSVQATSVAQVNHMIAAMAAMADIGGMLEKNCENVVSITPTSPLDLLERVNLSIDIRNRLAELLVDNTTLPQPANANPMSQAV